MMIFHGRLEQMLWSFVTNRADALPNFFEEIFAIYGLEAVQALEEAGAPPCAAALNAVVDTLPNGIYPKGDKEFWDSMMSGRLSAKRRRCSERQNQIRDYEKPGTFERIPCRRRRRRRDGSAAEAPFHPLPPGKERN